jgi:hypothetical protein
MVDVLPPPDGMPNNSDQDAVFVEEYVRSHDAVAACVKAGIRDIRYPITIAARAVLSRPEIRAAIAVLEKIRPPSEVVEITQESVVADMENVFGQALDAGEYQAAISAKKLQSEIRGWLKQNIAVTHRLDLDDLSDAQLAKIARRQMTDISDVGAVIDNEIPAAGVDNG